jgi:hypothetical protein
MRAARSCVSAERRCRSPAARDRPSTGRTCPFVPLANHDRGHNENRTCRPGPPADDRVIRHTPHKRGAAGLRPPDPVRVPDGGFQHPSEATSQPAHTGAPMWQPTHRGVDRAPPTVPEMRRSERVGGRIRRRQRPRSVPEPKLTRLRQQARTAGLGVRRGDENRAPPLFRTLAFSGLHARRFTRWLPRGARLPNRFDRRRGGAVSWEGARTRPTAPGVGLSRRCAVRLRSVSPHRGAALRRYPRRRRENTPRRCDPDLLSCYARKVVGTPHLPSSGQRLGTRAIPFQEKVARAACP